MPSSTRWCVPSRPPLCFPVSTSVCRGSFRSRLASHSSSFPTHSSSLRPSFSLPLFPKAAATSTSALERRDRVAAASARLEEAAPSIEKMRGTAAEQDPEKRIYNENITAKVLYLFERLAGLREKANAVNTMLNPLAEQEEAAATEAKAVTAKAKAEAERVAAEAKADAEAERIAAAAAAAAKQKEEEEAARVTTEREAARAKEEAETAAAKATAAAAKAAEAKAAAAAAETERARKAEEGRAKKAALVARVGVSTASDVSLTAAAAPDATTATTTQVVSTTPPPNAAALASMLASMSPPSITSTIASSTRSSTNTPSGVAKTVRGEVRHVLGGAAELRTALEEASAAGALTVVDWSIPTCGPCQRIRPAYAAMALVRQNVQFVGVDAHASAENASLARDASVRAFPTFHLYANMRRVGEMSGADETRLAALIDAHAAPAAAEIIVSPVPNSSPAVTASVPGSTTSMDTMQAAIASALTTLRGACAGLPEFVTATKTALLFVGNVLDNPGDGKYRKVRLANPGFRAKLGRFTGGIAVMEAFGFEKQGDGDDLVLVMSELSATHPGLPAMRALLESAVPPVG